MPTTSRINLPSFILGYIRENPGASRQQIVAALPEGSKATTVSATLRRLREDGVIENRAETGSNGLANRYRPAAWHIVKMSADQHYRRIASTLLQELSDLNTASAREDFLAKRLQDIFETEGES